MSNQLSRGSSRLFAVHRHWAVALGFALLGCLVRPHATAAPRPNVVLIMPDDLSYDDYSYYNPQGPRTPHVDALGRESVRLTDFHVSPTCSPSRASVMTGRYNDATGVWHTILGRYFLQPGEVTMADVFKANGYGTALFGKWHLGDSYPFRPRDRGFDHAVMIRGGGIDQQHDYWGNRNDPPATLYRDDQPVTLSAENGRLASDGSVFATNYFTSQAMDYMKQQSAAAQPFFVYLPYNVAHGPQDRPSGARPGVDAHTATVENLDRNVGRLLEFLDQSGLADNTLLVFVLGDNGMANKLYRGGKATAYEAGHRVPCFLRWKNAGYGGSAERGREMPRLVSHIDLLPTMIDLLGLHDVASRAPQFPMHGRSFKSLLDASPVAGEAGRTLVVDNQREENLIKYKEGCVMREELDGAGKIAHQWRLVIPSAAKPAELYDVQADPREKNNLAAEPGRARLVEALKAAYEAWWPTASATAADYTRPVLGTASEPATCLYAHDWHTTGNVPWNQEMIARGQNNNGFNSVAFGRAGDYTFDLRRWPKEIAGETMLTSALHTPLRAGSADSAGAIAVTTGKALPIHSARIRIWDGDRVYADERKTATVEADGVVFTVRSLPAGPAMVQTWFFDQDGHELCGAYYDYVTGP
jgi:arylsulfatase A-like enzyme